MIRINLLPPEILQKRKDEGRWRWVALAGIVAVVLLAGTFLILQFQVSIKQNEIAAAQQTAEGYKQQTARFQVFQEKRSDLENRRKIAQAALAGRVDWPRLLSEVALILPSDLYLVRLGATEPKPEVPGAAGQPGQPPTPGKLTLEGRALDVPNDVPDLGYRSIAKFLVRLAELEQLDSIWLTSSTKPTLTPEGNVPTLDEVFIVYSITADINSSSSTVAPTPISTDAAQQ